MNVCTFDNPATMQRECWQNGGLLCAYDSLILPDTQGKQSIPGDLYFFGANIGKWKSGQLIGSPLALPERERRLVLKERS